MTFLWGGGGGGGPFGADCPLIYGLKFPRIYFIFKIFKFINFNQFISSKEYQQQMSYMLFHSLCLEKFLKNSQKHTSDSLYLTNSQWLLQYFPICREPKVVPYTLF
jgi:hypothetical protein